MPRMTTRDKFFAAIDDSYDGALSAIEAAEARRHKASRTLLDEVQKGEKELVALARKWAESPTSFFDNFAAALDAQARAQRRALELARDSLAGAAEYRQEVRDALRRVLKANRAAGDAAVEGIRETYSRLRERLPGGEEEAKPSPRKDGHGQVAEKAAEPTRTAKAALD